MVFYVKHVIYHFPNKLYFFTIVLRLFSMHASMERHTLQKKNTLILTEESVGSRSVLGCYQRKVDRKNLCRCDFIGNKHHRRFFISNKSYIHTYRRNLFIFFLSLSSSCCLLPTTSSIGKI